MVSTAFDYTPLNGTGDKVRDSVKKIKAWSGECESHAKFTVQLAMKIGNELLSVREKIPHGLWNHWLDMEFSWSYRTALSYMNIAQRFKSAIIADLNLTVLSLLAGDSVPQAAVEEVLSKAAEGEKVTVADAKDVIQKHTNRITGAGTKPAGPAPATKPSRLPAVEETDSHPVVNPEPVAPVPEVKAQPTPIELMNQALRIASLLSIEDLGKLRNAIDRLHDAKAGVKPVAAMPNLVTPVAVATESVAPRAKDSLLEFDAADMKVPQKFEGDRFRRAWREWVQYNAEEGHPLTESVAVKQMQKLTDRSLDAAVATIDKAIADRSKSFPAAKESRPTFVPPTLDEVKAYAQDSGILRIFDSPEKFMAHYECNGWKVGKNPMKDWKAAVRSWAHRKQDEAQKRPTGSAANNGAYNKFESDRMKPHANGQQRNSGATSVPVEGSTRRPA